MKNERDVEHLRFKIRELAVRTEHIQNVFRSGQILLRRMDIQAVSVLIVPVRLVGIDREYREQRDKFETLSENVRNARVAGVVVI